MIVFSSFLFGCSAPRLNKQIIQPIIKVAVPKPAAPSLKDVIASVGNNVVYIFTYNSDGKPSGYGTGFVVGKNGLIATAGHLAGADAATVFVRFRENNMAVVARVETITKSENTDVALLKIKHVFKTQAQMEQREVKNDEPMFVLGHPLTRPYTLPFNAPPKLLRGRFFMYFSLRITSFPAQRTMLIDMNGAYGNSGSPIFDKTGKVVGIYVAVNPKMPGTFTIALEAKHIMVLLLQPASQPASRPATLPAK